MTSPEVPVTVEERAEKMVETIVLNDHLDFDWRALFIQNLQAAREEGYKKGQSDECYWWSNSDQKDVLAKSYTLGFNSAIEKAAKVAEAPMSPEDKTHPDECYACDCHGEVPQEHYPPRIRALKAWG